MTDTGDLSRRCGRVGVAGLLVSFVAAFVHETPGAMEYLAWFIDTAITIMFQIAAVLTFVIGLAVIIYSYLKQQHGTVSERVHRITGVGVCSVLGLSLLFPVVIIQDLVRILAPMLSDVGPGVPTRLYFYGCITLFGALAFIRVLDIVSRRFRVPRT